MNYYLKLYSPCKECKNKGCGSFHDRCKKYQDYKKELDKREKEKKKWKYSKNLKIYISSAYFKR